MKKSLSHTRVSVKLRKAEFRKEWYLYIESYPVICKNGGKPQRVREYVNRTITSSKHMGQDDRYPPLLGKQGC